MPSTTPHPRGTKSVLPVLFFTLFIDLVGFSIIFPLFPAMLQYYLQAEPLSWFLSSILAGVEELRIAAGVPSSKLGDAVLFGGILGSLYSLLQFACAPIIGALSDRFGRRPILLLSIAGLAFSYALWFVAAPFWVLLLARLLGGVMSGNISTATAAVADVTEREGRTKGMAFIGMAFGFGFILGPAIGGLSALVDLTVHLPALIPYGVNPFSMPAAVAFVLSLLNLIFVFARFPETLPPERRGRRAIDRTANLFRLFRPMPYRGAQRVNMANFLFLVSFSGMEFSLTFLAAERLGYGPARIGMMLCFVGVVLALVQGGYVRRQAARLGAKRIALQGFVCLIPSLVLIGAAHNVALLYAALFLLAVGSAQIVPCLTSLASLYAPPDQQGRVIGMFRSLGALGRAIGPLAACVVYWRLGSSIAYYAAAVFLLLPFALAATLPKPEQGA